MMDSAYDAPEVRAHSESLGHVVIIDVNPRRAERKRELAAEAKARRRLGHASCEQVRFRERSTVERVKGRLKACPGLDPGTTLAVVSYVRAVMARFCAI